MSAVLHDRARPRRAAAPTDPITAPAISFSQTAPVLILLGGAVLAILFEAFLPRSLRYPVQVGFAVIVVAAALVWTLVGAGNSDYGVTFGGAVAVDAATYVMWGVLLVLALPSVLLMADRVSEPGGSFVTQAAAKVGSARDRVATRVGAPMQTEVFPLALFAIGGMMVFPAATDTVTLFVALEVLSLPLYLLCGLARRRRLISQEAAVKYFLLGAFTSAIFVYGLALLYGYSGSTSFASIASQARAGDSSDVLLIGGLALVLVGLLFKASVGPFHLWTPDVYQGAPTPVTAFMASCTKVAAFAAMLRVCQAGAGADDVDLAAGARGDRRRVDDHRLGHRHHPDRHEADARLLLGRARRLHPAGRAGDVRERRVGDDVLPAHLRHGHHRRVRDPHAWSARATARPRTSPTGPGWPSARRCWPRR